MRLMPVACVVCLCLGGYADATQVFPGATQSSFTQLWRELVPADQVPPPARLEHVFLELAVMGAARHLPSLSSHYIVWSPWVVPLSSEQVFFHGDKAVFVTAPFHEGTTEDQARLQAIAHHQVFERATGLHMLHPSSAHPTTQPSTAIDDYASETWQSHQFVVKRACVRVCGCVACCSWAEHPSSSHTSGETVSSSRFMDELLQHIESRANVNRGSWLSAMTVVLTRADHLYLPESLSSQELYAPGVGMDWLGVLG